jgi:phage gp29-like protein
MKKGIWIDKNTFVQFSDKTTNSLSNEIATRQRSIDFYSLGMYLPNPDPVLKKMGKDIAVYNELMSDGHLGGCVTSREAGVKSLEWMIDRDKAPSRQATVISDVFDNMDIDNILSEMLKAPLFGYSPLEVLWERVGGYILPKDIVGKPHEWFVFDEGNKLRFRTKTNYNGKELPPRKFLLARHKPTYQNPYGFAELSRCFWPVTFKRGGFKFWVKFAEKYGMPFLWGKLPRGLDQKEYDALADSLENMVQDAIAVTPDDASVEMLTVEGQASGDIYRNLISECKSEVSIALLGQNLTTEVKGGSFAATKAHMEVRKDITESDKKVCERVFNELIGWIFELNFASGARPVFSMYEQEDVDKTLAERDKLLTEAGVKFRKSYFVKAYSLDDEDIEEITDQASMNNNQLAINNDQLKTRRGDAITRPDAYKAANEFAEQMAALFPDQQAVDAALEGISREELQAQVEGVLKPVIGLVQESSDYAAVMEKLVAAYPDMDTKAVEEMLSRAIFVSELWGRLTTGNRQ